MPAHNSHCSFIFAQQEFTKALDDATASLSFDADSVKTLLRRATAANGLGRHRQAMDDLTRAQALEPQNKQVIVDLRKTQELRKVAMRRATRVKVPVTIGHIVASADAAGNVSDVTSID